MGTLFAVTATKEFLYFARDDQEPPQLTLEDAAKEAIDDSDLWDEIETIEVLNPADELTSDALAEIAYGDREGDASVADLIKNGFLVRKPEPTARARPLVFPPEYENIQKYYPKTLVREVLHPNRGRGFWVKDTYFSPEAARLFSTRVLSSTNTKKWEFHPRRRSGSWVGGFEGDLGGPAIHPGNPRVLQKRRLVADGPRLPYCLSRYVWRRDLFF